MFIIVIRILEIINLNFCVCVFYAQSQRIFTYCSVQIRNGGGNPKFPEKTTNGQEKNETEGLFILGIVQYGFKPKQQKAL